MDIIAAVFIDFGFKPNISFGILYCLFFLPEAKKIGSMTFDVSNIFLLRIQNSNHLLVLYYLKEKLHSVSQSSRSVTQCFSAND